MVGFAKEVVDGPIPVPSIRVEMLRKTPQFEFTASHFVFPEPDAWAAAMSADGTTR